MVWFWCLFDRWLKCCVRNQPKPSVVTHSKSNAFPLHQKTRQGCCMSPCILYLPLESLSLSIRNPLISALSTPFWEPYLSVILHPSSLGSDSTLAHFTYSRCSLGDAWVPLILSKVVHRVHYSKRTLNPIYPSVHPSVTDVWHRMVTFHTDFDQNCLNIWTEMFCWYSNVLEYQLLCSEWPALVFRMLAD